MQISLLQKQKKLGPIYKDFLGKGVDMGDDQYTQLKRQSH